MPKSKERNHHGRFIIFDPIHIEPMVQGDNLIGSGDQDEVGLYSRRTSLSEDSASLRRTRSPVLFLVPRQKRPAGRETVCSTPARNSQPSSIGGRAGPLLTSAFELACSSMCSISTAMSDVHRWKRRRARGFGTLAPSLHRQRRALALPANWND